MEMLNILADQVILSNQAAPPWCFTDVILRSHNSWYMPSESGDWTVTRHKNVLPDTDFIKLSSIVTKHFVGGGEATTEKNIHKNKLRSRSASPSVVYARRLPPRCVVNLDDVVRYVGATGPRYTKIKVHFFHKLPMKEQVTIIHSADIFVGVHGAALTSLMFLKRQATVVEVLPWLFPEEGDLSVGTEEEQSCVLEQCAVYYNMAKHLGIRHLTLIGEEKEEKGVSEEKDKVDYQRGENLRNRPVVLNPQKFLATIDNIAGG
jgi:hypothetical protein